MLRKIDMRNILTYIISALLGGLVCNALYGILMLRLQGKEISEGTQKAVAQISYFIGMLAAYFKKDEEKPLFEDDVE